MVPGIGIGRYQFVGSLKWTRPEGFSATGVKFHEEFKQFLSLWLWPPDVGCLRVLVFSGILKELYSLVDQHKLQVSFVWWELLLDGCCKSWEVDGWGVGSQ